MARIKFNNRKIGLGLLLLVTVLAAIWPTPDQNAIVTTTKENISARTIRPTATTMPEALFSPLASNTEAGTRATVNDLFPAQTWTPPAPPPPASKQEPAAPPLPFAFAGRYVDGNDTMIFLKEGDQMLRVRKGDTIREVYRVDKIEPAAISLTYLPLGTLQTLPTGGLLP